MDEVVLDQLKLTVHMLLACCTSTVATLSWIKLILLSN